MNKKTIYVAHGAIYNSGDFLIYNRGMKFLKKYLLSKEIELIPVERWKPIEGKCDALVILGGPIITQKMHSQANNIKKYLEMNKVPVICLGLGINKSKFKNYDEYFIDSESISFWKEIFNSSQLFSVRDKETLCVLEAYQIKPIMTGCPALYNITNNNDNNLNNGLNVLKKYNEICITTPNLSKISPEFIKTLFFMVYLKKTILMNKLNIQGIVYFQHGFISFLNNVIEKFVRMMHFKTYDGSNKNIEDVEYCKNAGIHIGTRLHMNIYFLSMEKASYLFNIDSRTEGFIKTIKVPSEDYTFNGIIKLVNALVSDMENPDQLNSEIHLTQKNISEYYVEMASFMENFKSFVERI